MDRSYSKSQASLAALLLSLEVQLMQSAFRRDRQQVSALLAAEFREFGSSGRVWSREAILDLLATEEAYTAPAVEGFAMQRLGPEVALVTYRTIRTIRTSDESDAPQETLRSSLWVLRADRWQVLFHQGTKVPEL